jgi:outer membrane receptor for ferrienterochelin and colicin
MRSLPMLTLGAALLAAGCASQPVPKAVDGATATVEPSPHCLRSTGTRLNLPEGECAIASGRVITREELERRSGVHLTDALRTVVY